jgi:hypothetical protein
MAPSEAGHNLGQHRAPDRQNSKRQGTVKNSFFGSLQDDTIATTNAVIVTIGNAFTVLPRHG